MPLTNKKTFKDFITEDLDVFFNAEEFAKEHSLQGEQLLCIVIDGENKENNTGISADHRQASQETYVIYKRVYIKSELFFLPKIKSVIELDGEEYYVEEASEQTGIIYMLLTLNES